MAETSKIVHRSKTFKSNFPKRNVSSDHKLKKRSPQKQYNKENDIYVTKNINIKAYILKCEKILEKNHKEIVIHCMGAAIQQGINLALQLTEKYPLYQIDVNTNTVNLIDDLEPMTDEADFETQKRANSALQIKVIKNTVSKETKK